MAVKSTSGQIVVLDAQCGQTVVDFENAEDGEGSNLRYSPCGSYIVDGTWSGLLSVRRASSGSREFVQDFRDIIRSVHGLDDGKHWVIAHGAKATSDDQPPLNYFSVWRWPFGSG